MPYCGDGDLAELYHDRTLAGIDLDAARVQTFASRHPDAIAIHGDCEKWHTECDGVNFAIADLDAYGNPYKAFVCFWQHAVKSFPLVCFFTDGLRLHVQRGDVIWDFVNHRTVRTASPQEGRRQFNFWLKRHAVPYVESIIAPRRVTALKFYSRRHMIYWGCVIE